MLDTLSLIVVSPEIVLLVMTCVIALVDLGVTSRLRGLTYWLTLVTLAAVAFLTADFAVRGETFYAFGKMVVSDPMGNWLKCFSAIAPSTKYFMAASVATSLSRRSATRA